MRNEKKREEDEGGENGAEVGSERNVRCEVEVVSWRERRIRAETLVHADVESVWNALTDYERLADFVPNLVSRLLQFLFLFFVYLWAMFTK